MTDSINRSSELKRVLGSLHCDFEAENPNEYSYSQKCKWCGEIRTNQCHTLFGEIEALYTSPEQSSDVATEFMVVSDFSLSIFPLYAQLQNGGREEWAPQTVEMVEKAYATCTKYYDKYKALTNTHQEKG